MPPKESSPAWLLSVLIGLGMYRTQSSNAFAAYNISSLIDPKFVASVKPVQCNETDCLSLFLPGEMDSV